jgi:predicted amidohydrolase
MVHQRKGEHLKERAFTMAKIDPYNAVGLVPTVRGISRREDIMVNIEHHKHMVKAASWLAGLDLPVKLVAIPEGALQGFNDEVLDLDHVEFANTGAIDIPGPETDALGEIAKEYDVYIMAQAKARHPEIKDRFFNVGFIINPEGDVILQHYKVVPLLPVEHSMTPHDIFDWWVERYGRTLDAFFPVVDTDIGRMGIMMANEGSYPEYARALAMNGAEIVYRASIPHPAASNDYYEIQTRARALDNNMYVMAPNMGTYYLTQDSDTPIDTFGGKSMIVDYRGQLVGKQDYGGVSTSVCGPVNIEALRHHRTTSKWTNWMKDLKTEMIQLIYEEAIYPKNLYADRAPMTHDEYAEEVTKTQIAKLVERGIWKEPSK